MARRRARRPKSYGIQRTKRLPVGRVTYGAKITPRGRNKLKVYGHYEV